MHTQRIKHLGTKCCFPHSSSGIYVSWLISLHPEPRSCQTEPIPCCWWAGAVATSCREWPWQWTTPSRQAPCGLKNQHQRDRNWRWTLKDDMSTEGSWPLGVPYQWLGDSPPVPSTLSAEPIWHVWRPRAWFASMRALSRHLIYSDQCTLEAWCWGLNPWCSVCDPSVLCKNLLNLSVVVLRRLFKPQDQVWKSVTFSSFFKKEYFFC